MTRANRFLFVGLVAACLAGNAFASPWFSDNFDSYGTGTTPDDNLFRAAWAFEATDYPGRIQADVIWLFSSPFEWKENKNFNNVRARRSLIPAIQAVDPSKNAVNGTDNTPLVFKFQTVLGTAVAGTDEKVLLWMELIGQDITSGAMDAAFSSPNKNPGSYGTAVGVCDVGGTNTCTAGWYKMVGKGCSRNSDCDTPMWLDWRPNPANPMVCTVLDQSLSVPRPALAVGAYGGTNGLVPKAEPGNNCASLGTTGLAQMVTFDGDKWARMSGPSLLGSSSDGIRTSRSTTDVTVTIRDTDYDVTVDQPVTCDYAGRCDSKATCYTALPGNCVNNVCLNNGNACSTDADCNFCSDNPTQACTTDAQCRSYLCEGGANAGTACPDGLDTVCVDYSNKVCMGGSTDGQVCTETAGALSTTCGRRTTTKSHIPRQYTGPFQTLAMGPGHVYDGNNNNIVGSDNQGLLDTITLEGGQFVSVATGGCCLPDNSCVMAMEAACLQIDGAFYAGDNVACEQARCDAGACCTAQGCVADKTQSECAALSGQWQGRGTTCANGTCMGACCGAQGSCTDTYVNTCPSGDFRGPGTDCATSVPCCPTPYGDWDGDNDMDMTDFATLQKCLDITNGTIPTGCMCFDHNHDGFINQVDVGLFVDCATGPGIAGTVAPACMP